jgi:TolB-like protein/Tfp pilus assembly protein PilF
LSAEPNALTELAASVADGTPIDWEQVQAAAGARQERLVRHLRLVSSVADLYRSLPPEPGEGLAAAAEPSGPRWGNLVILESLGKGTSAEVFRAWDTALQRDVALKLFPPDDGGSRAHDRVLAEARRLARVRHPNVATVYGAERHGDRVGFWMELVRGSSLDEILQRQGPFGAREAALVGIEVASALAAVHQAGLLHRDVKAQNVLREEGGRIVLTDFGTGEEVNAPGPARMAGTPMYLAPEILRGRSATVRSDIYSLGVLLYLLTTGKFPFDAANMMDLARGHAEGRRRRVRDLRPDLPAPLSDAIERALAADPAERYATAGAFDEALRRTLDPAVHVGTPAPAESAPLTARQTHPRVIPAAAAAAALVVGVLAVLWLTGPWRANRTSPAGVQTIAVLPLEDLTNNAGPAHMAEGLTDQLIATLGQIHGLSVTSRTSVMASGARTGGISQIAKRLGVTSVLEGTVAVDAATAGSRAHVRVNARLIAAGTDTQIWSGTFERALGDTFALQADLARAIAREVKVAVSPIEAARLERRQTTAPEAEAAYFEGQHYLSEYGPENAARALAAFEKAVQLDVNYAPAYAGLARTYVKLGNERALAPADARAKAFAMAARAMELDDQLADAHTAVADLKFAYDWDWNGAQEAYERALDLNPSSSPTRQQFARYLAAMARTGEAVQQAQRAAEVDPLSRDALQTEALMWYFARRYDAAEHALKRATELDPDAAGTYAILSRVREAEQRYRDALAEANKALAITDYPGVRALAAREMALGGDTRSARAELTRLTIAPQHSRPDSRAYVFLALGEADRALALLEQAEAERDQSILWLAVDPRVDALRGHPRFVALLGRMGLPSSIDLGRPRQ